MKEAREYDIQALVEKYGSPLFVASAEAIKNNLETFRREFSSRYPRVVVSYSYKVNSIPGILEVIHRDGTWAEAASGFEYEIARKLGVPGTSIVFNGPFKKKAELEKALAEGAIINVDNHDELKALEGITAESGRRINVGIRINTDVGIDQLPDRFGFNIESGEAARVLKECSEKKLLNVMGIHVHLTSYIIETGGEGGTPARDIKLIWPKAAAAYQRAARNIVSLAKEARLLYGTEMEYIDMGGGFPSVDSLSPYVEAIAGPILSGFKESELPLLILEPGRAIVSNAVDLISTVVSSKDMPGGERAVVIDAGVNLLPTSFWRYQTVECADDPRGEFRKTTVYGPLCLQTDIICRTDLPELTPGDRLVIKNVGAYNIPQSGAFIFPRPPVVLIEDGGTKIIRRAETIDDIDYFENRT